MIFVYKGDANRYVVIVAAATKAMAASWNGRLDRRFRMLHNPSL